MSSRAHASQPGCRLETPSPEPMLEFAAFGFPLGGAFVVGWPAAPGAVRHDAAGRPVLLHFAPARWLVPAPHPDIAALIDAATQAGAGAVVDVDGKWKAVELLGPGAARLLASTIDVEAVLGGRECAAVTLFDCPAVLARVPDGFGIWVRSSYAADFVAAAEALRHPD
jgi:heterotetrameric sarcosine oxidase gamma subunit